MQLRTPTCCTLRGLQLIVQWDCCHYVLCADLQACAAGQTIQIISQTGFHDPQTPQCGRFD